jgi:hypothetical protein
MIQKNIEKIIIGAALVAASSVILPIAKKTLRPLLANGLTAGEGLMHRARSYVQFAKEEVEDIVAEAQFERMKKQLDKEISSMETPISTGARSWLDMEDQEQSVDFHLQQALSHLDAALNKSIKLILDNQGEKQIIGNKWEKFLGEFFGMVREKGKQSKMNLLTWVKFPRIR